MDPIEIKRGLDLPIEGVPRQKIVNGRAVSTVAIIGDDYVGMKPTMLVKEGDAVKLGQAVFADKKTEGVTYTAPGTGKVIAINRGSKRKFESLVIELDGDQEETFDASSDLHSIPAEKLRETLLKSGLWTCIRTRPYGKTPAPSTTPSSIFVTAIDTHPLSADPATIIGDERDHFINGLIALTRFGVPIHLCKASGAEIPGEAVEGVHVQEFSGPHPAGLVGTHIHFVDPVGPQKTVWHLNYQDLIAIGHLMTTGRILTDRTVSIAGPLVAEPKLYTTRIGASLDDLLDELIDENEVPKRVVSGSVLHGRTSETPVNFLGRFHLQVSVLQEGNHREFLGWQRPGLEKFSVTGAFAGSWLAKFAKRFKFNTNVNGSKRAMVPIGSYEKVMPLDILPTQLLRALIARDTEDAQALGCLELDEEDLSLCTYCCPGKYEYGSILRENLTQIEKEG
ncbi:MAG: Na(+)-translocating NADH-quinone reductase subunit A [Planctomycetota bacterium]|nr:Na(+)-translocating NADH-quinone reductase subunit A [Planctomycetota bacterium]